MLDNYLLKGCGTALVTPFNEDQTVDYEAFGRMVTRQIDNGAWKTTKRRSCWRSPRSCARAALWWWAPAPTR